MELTERIAESIVATTYDALPESARRAAKIGLLDTIGVMVPPTSIDRACGALADLVRDEVDGGPSTLIGFGAKSSAIMAAFLNGSCAHALDFDDTVDEINQHPSAQVVPAVLALAEKIGGVSGEDLLTAIAVGQDIGVRLSASRGEASKMETKWFSITTFGPFYATIAAAKLLRLNKEQTINAIGLALHRCHGQVSAVTDRDSELRAIRDGLTSKDGVLSALMAQKGVKATHKGIEILYSHYYDNDFSPDKVLLDLGSYFRGAEAAIKPWPSCRVTHGYIQATRDLMSENKLAVSDIDKIIAEVGPTTEHLLCEPAEYKRAPTESIQAKFSLYFTIALGAVKNPELSDFLPQNLGRRDVLELAKRVEYRPNPECGTITPVIVEIVPHHGTSVKKRVLDVYGHPNNPLPVDTIIDKFVDCVSYAKRPMEEEKARRLADYLLNIDQRRSVDELALLLP
jgi:2-methylcitrate dehydratase PrpD